jgi:DNA-binding NarL/FixJ family response regulator
VRNAGPKAVGARAARCHDDGVLDEAARPAERRGLAALTPREREVLQLVAAGLTNAQAARSLELSVHAIKFHLAEIYRRLGVTNRTEAAVAFLRATNGTHLEVTTEND